MLTSYDPEARRKQKMKSDDRTLILVPMEGKNPRDSKGNIDPRLFNGENNLHGIYNEMTGMWYLKYEVGGLPEPLKQQFLTFGDLETTVRQYFAKRNVTVLEIVD